MTIPSQKKQVEQMAKELFEYINDPLLWEACDQDKKIKDRFLKLGKYVLGLIIQARIDESSRLDNYEQTKKRLEELKKQLQSLNPPKER